MEHAGCGPSTGRPVLLLLPAAEPSARQIFYFATPGASHTLRFSHTLTGAWGTLANPATGDGTWINRTLSLDGPQRFFRLEQTPLPLPQTASGRLRFSL